MKFGCLARWHRQLSIEHIWALTALGGILIFLNLHPIRPHDFWWHMAVGREIVQTGQIPAVDAYSLTQRGQPYPSYSMFWLVEVYFYLVYALGGPALIVFAHSLMVGSAYAVLLYLGRKISGSWRLAAFSMLFAAALGINDWNVRPQAVTFLIGALYLLAIHQLQTGGRRLWLLTFPVGMLVWVNSHGTFFVGLVLLGLWLGDVLWQRWRAGKPSSRWGGLVLPLAALASAVAATLVNPRGLGVLAYLWQMLGSSPVQNLVTEWAAPSFETLHGALFLAGLLLSATVLAISPERPSFHQLLTFLFFAALGLKTGRGAIWFGIVMAPVLAVHFQALAELAARRSRMNSIQPLAARWLNSMLVVLILLACLASLPWFKANIPLPEAKRGLVSSETPLAATQFLLNERLPGPVFHHMAYGSYLIWAAQPDYPVFVDPRIELYPYSFWIDYINISNAFGDWSNRLERYGIQTLFLNPIDQGALIEAVLHSDLWRQVYQDEQAVIFVRDK